MASNSAIESALTSVTAVSAEVITVTAGWQLSADGTVKEKKLSSFTGFKNRLLGRATAKVVGDIRVSMFTSPARKVMCMVALCPSGASAASVPVDALQMASLSPVILNSFLPGGQSSALTWLPGVSRVMKGCPDGDTGEALVTLLSGGPPHLYALAQHDGASTVAHDVFITISCEVAIHGHDWVKVF